MQSTMEKFYAVKIGRTVGIYNTWEECKAQVEGYSGSEYKSFKTEKEATEYLGLQSSEKKPEAELSPVGTFAREVYTNEQYGTTIASYRDKDGEAFTVTGYMLPTGKGVKYRFSGEWIKHPKYGKQFKADSYEEIIGHDIDSIRTYLSSGLIKGVGKATADKIIAKFGVDTITILDNEIERIAEVRGISAKKAATIKESYIQNRQARDIILKLSKYGISPKLSMKVYAKFKEQTMHIILTKPYLLSLIKGISFPVADAIGNKDADYELSYERFKTGAKFILLQNENGIFRDNQGNRVSGSIGMEKDFFGRIIYSMLHVKELTQQHVLDYTVRMIREGELVYKKIEDVCLLFLPGMYRIELATAKHIKRIADGSVREIRNLDSLIDRESKKLGITLSPEQHAAIKMAFEYNLSLIIGPPGTGKTTTITVIKEIYKIVYQKDMVFLAPSGKAASRIRQTSGEFATTVHSGCEINTEIITDVLPEEEIKFEEGLIVVDEMSMLDARTAYQMFASISPECMVVLCGDDEQLQSVGAGAVLRDMIDSGVIPVTVLSTVYRQGKDCNIYSNSFKIRSGKTDLTYGDDFQFVKADSPLDMQNEMIRLYWEKVDEYGIENVMLTAPFKNHEAGVYALNEIIQNVKNPYFPGRDEMKGDGKIFRIDDLVMQLKNDSESGVANGDIGVVIAIEREEDGCVMKVRYSSNGTNLYKEYTKDNLEEVCLAYAYTNHKSQGSEAKCVITCIHSMHSIMLKRNIIYTAVTRASEEVIVVGQKAAIEQAIRTEDKTKRYTALKVLLQVQFGKLVKL